MQGKQGQNESMWVGLGYTTPPAGDWALVWVCCSRFRGEKFIQLYGPVAHPDCCPVCNTVMVYVVENVFFFLTAVEKNNKYVALVIHINKEVAYQEVRYFYHCFP